MGVELALLEPEVESSVDEIVSDFLRLDANNIDKDGNYPLHETANWDVAFHSENLEELVDVIFDYAPITYNSLSDRDVDLLKFAVYHAILGYGDKERKLGAHRYLNHPLLVAQVIATAFEKAGRKEINQRDIVALVMSGLYHDRVEERVDKLLKKQMKLLREETEDVVFAHPKEDAIYDAFSDIGKKIDPINVGSTPVYEGDLEVYMSNLQSLLERHAGADGDYKRIKKRLSSLSVSEDEILSLISRSDKKRAKTRERLRKKKVKGKKQLEKEELQEAKRYAKHLYIQRTFRTHALELDEARENLGEYERILKKYIPDLNGKVIEAEKPLVQQEMNVFSEELFSLFRSVYGDSEDTEEQDVRLSDIALESARMTRLGSELYYEVCSQLYASVVKYADRIANSLDIDRAERNPNIRYFSFDKTRKKLDLSELLELEVDEESGVHFSFYLVGETFPTIDKYVADENLDIITLLEISPEDEEKIGIRALDEALHEIIRAQHEEYHLKDNNAEEKRWRNAKDKKPGYENDPPQRLPTHKRLYHLYKNILLINNTREGYKGHVIPPMLRYMHDQLIDITQQEARRIIEGTFSNHCKGEKEHFSIHDAREIYREMKQYELDEGFEEATEEGESRFDGLLKRYFDQRARGSRRPSEKLFRDKKEIFATALAVHRLTELYQEKPKWYMKNIGKKGPDFAPPKGVTRDE